VGVCTGVTLVKSFTYRGQAGEQWSNRYHFRDNPPTTASEWNTLALALASHEKLLYPSTCEIVQAYGYDSDDPKAPSVWQGYWADDGVPVPGTYAPGAGEHGFAGDQAAMVWWRLELRDSRGKWIYLRKYFHAGQTDQTAPDNLSGPYKSAIATFADAMNPSKGAFNGGLRRLKDTTPILYDGSAPTVTTRTLKRRGKRPPPPA